MIAIFQLPNGEFLTDGRVPLPQPNSVNWRREYPVDEAHTTYRVAPVFNDVEAAIAWLDNIIESRRQETIGPFPRKKRPFGVLASENSRNEAFDKQLPGIGPTHQYEGYIETNGCQMDALLFRGDAGLYPLIPTLSRCLWPAFIEKAVSRADALNALYAEETCTSSFVDSFFSDRKVQAQFPWVKNQSPALRAAIARHFGFYSWILDFTVDPAIAAFFATGAGDKPPQKGQWGSFWVIDEGYLEELLGEPPFVEMHPGHESRSWAAIDVETIRVNAGLGLENLSLNRVGVPDFWALLTAQLDEGFFLNLHYAPGLEVERMWQQKWCGVEPFPPIGVLPRRLRRLLKTRQLGNPTPEYIINSQLLFQRLCSCVYFIQSGERFQMPERGVTSGTLLPPNDDFLICVNAYSKSKDFAPGAAHSALLRQKG